MNRLNIIFIIIGIGVTALVIVAVMSATYQTNLSIEKLKLIKGEISVFQYCSHIGKAAIDDENCEEFNLLYGPRN